jgi:predicted negative regulator of RcsB-dependent stress response
VTWLALLSVLLFLAAMAFGWRLWESEQEIIIWRERYEELFDRYSKQQFERISKSYK